MDKRERAYRIEHDERMGETIGKVPAVSRPVGQSVHPYDYRTLHVCNTLVHKQKKSI